MKKTSYALTVLSAILAGCSDNPSTTSINETEAALAPSSFSLLDIEKTQGSDLAITFTWQSADEALSYQLCRVNSDYDNGCEPIGDVTTSTSLSSVQSPLSILDGEYFVLATNDNGSTKSNEVAATSLLINQLITYVKATNTDSDDGFGVQVALSGDGLTLAVSATAEDSNAMGVNGNGADNSAGSAGAVYVYGFDGERWEQQAYIKASNSEAGDEFGQSIALSDDGRTLAVSAWFEDSNAKGINGDQLDNSGIDSGAVYLYRFDGRDWTQEAYIKATNTGLHDWFGHMVSLSGNGNVLAVGAPEEDSNASGVNGDQTDNSLNAAGAVYLYRFDGQNWLSDAYIKASNTGQGDKFGFALSLSDNGSRLAVSAPEESSDAKGVNGDEANELARASGAVYVYDYDGQAWSQKAYIKASNTDIDDNFGLRISLAGDGQTLAVSTPSEKSSSTSINGDELDNTAADAGAVYLYRFSGQSWVQESYIKATNTDANDYFGNAVSLSENGNMLAVGAVGESSREQGVTLSSSDNSVFGAGAVYVYRYDGNSWVEYSYLKSSNSEAQDFFGYSIYRINLKMQA